MARFSGIDDRASSQLQIVTERIIAAHLNKTIVNKLKSVNLAR